MSWTKKWCAFELIDAWDYWLFPNPHVLAVYLNFVPTMENSKKGLKNVNVWMTIFVLIIEFEFLVMAIIVGQKV
jgi:hypothetical protein